MHSKISSFNATVNRYLYGYQIYAMDRKIIATFFRNYKFAFHRTKYTIDTYMSG